VLAVLGFHAGVPQLSGGFLGVDIFFAISGYLITSIILREQQSDTFTLADFYERRIRRIYPALIIVAIYCVPAAYFTMLPRDFNGFGESLIAVPTFITNLYFWQTSDYFSTELKYQPLLHIWSLAVEEQFYLLFPLFMLLIRRLSTGAIFIILLTCAFASLFVAHLAGFNAPVANFYLTPTRAWEILAGSIVAFYVIGMDSKPAGLLPPLVHVAEITALLLILVPFFSFSEQTTHPGLPTLIPLAGTCYFLLFGARGILKPLFNNIILVWIGLISYSIYLWHHAIFAFYRTNTSKTESSVNVLLLSLFSIAMGYLSWRFVEKPFRTKHFLTRKQIFTWALIASIGLIAVGATIAINKGFPKRLNAMTRDFVNIENGDSSNCRNSLTDMDVKEGLSCIVGDPQSTPSVALIGDSHAAGLTDALAEKLAAEGKSAHVFTGITCVPLYNFGTYDPKKNPECRDFIRETLDRVANDENIETVLLFAEWPYYAVGARLNQRVRSAYDDSTIKNKDPERNGEFFTNALNTTMGLMAKHGKTVFLIGSVPEYEINVPNEIARQIYKGGNTTLPQRFQIKKDQVKKRNQDVTKAFSEARNFTNTKIYWPPDDLCAKTFCTFMTPDNKPLYSDSNHLSKIGGRFIINNLESSLGF